MDEYLLACVNCHTPLLLEEEQWKCETCNTVFRKNKYGYISITDLPISTTTDEYAATQCSRGRNVYEDYLKPYLLKASARRILDVGCGIGLAVSCMLEDGFDAYGIDIPDVSRYWGKMGNDPKHFFCFNATHLPFRDNSFDVTYSLGVIEHIGTRMGKCTLGDNYQQARQEFASEILRITKPGGRIVIACPNKHFPIDIQHCVRDKTTPITLGNRIRHFIFTKTGMNIHPTWGKYHLLSYSECRKLFRGKRNHKSFTPLPLKGYFGFSAMQSGFLKPLKALGNLCINRLPRSLRSGCLNPYMLVEIRKHDSLQ